MSCHFIADTLKYKECTADPGLPAVPDPVAVTIPDPAGAPGAKRGMTGGQRFPPIGRRPITLRKRLLRSEPAGV